MYWPVEGETATIIPFQIHNVREMAYIDYVERTVKLLNAAEVLNSFFQPYSNRSMHLKIISTQQYFQSTSRCSVVQFLSKHLLFAFRTFVRCRL